MLPFHSPGGAKTFCAWWNILHSGVLTLLFCVLHAMSQHALFPGTACNPTLAPAMHQLQSSYSTSGKPCAACSAELLEQGLLTPTPTEGTLGLQQLCVQQSADAEALRCPAAAGGHAAYSQALPQAASWHVWWVCLSASRSAEARMLWLGGKTVSKLPLGGSAPMHAVAIGHDALKAVFMLHSPPACSGY